MVDVPGTDVIRRKISKESSPPLFFFQGQSFRRETRQYWD